MLLTFALATFMVGLTVTIHFGGLLGLLWLLRGSGHRFRPHESAAGQGTRVSLCLPRGLRSAEPGTTDMADTQRGGERLHRGVHRLEQLALCRRR